MEMAAAAEEDVLHLQEALSDWKYIVVEADMWLKWDEDTYPYMMCLVVTVSYLFLWLMAPPLITTVSLLLMMVCLLDFLVPSVFKEYLNRQAWTNYKQDRYERCCLQLVRTQHSITSFVNWVINLRERKPKSYFLGASVSLLTIAFIGNAIPGLLLAYLCTIILVLLPGLIYHGILMKYYAMILQVFVSLIKVHKKKD